MKRFFIIIIFAFISSSLFAQLQVGQSILPLYTKAPEFHNFAMQSYSPAVPKLIMFADTRMDAFKRHPMGATLLCSGFLVDKLGAGLIVHHEQIGLSSQTNIQLGLSYYVRLTKASDDKQGGDKLSFSLAGNFILDRINQNDLIILDPNDPSLVDVATYNPGGNASAGIAILRENKYYAGFSVNNLLNTKSTFRNPTWENIKWRHYFLMGAYTFNLSKEKTIDLEINGIATTNDFKRIGWEAGIDFKCLKAFSLGAGYRSNGSLKFDASVNAQSWTFGYGCGFGAWVDATQYTYKGTSHCIFIRKVFNEGRRSHKWNASSFWL